MPRPFRHLFLLLLMLLPLVGVHAGAGVYARESVELRAEEEAFAEVLVADVDDDRQGGVVCSGENIQGHSSLQGDDCSRRAIFLRGPPNAEVFEASATKVWSKHRAKNNILGAFPEREFIELSEDFFTDPKLVKGWVGSVTLDLPPAVRKRPTFLKAFDEILENVGLSDYLFKGKIEITGGVPGAYQFKVSGVHHADALNGVTARIKSGSKTTPNSKGYYKGKVEMHHPDNVNNGGWKVKSTESTFFPDAWSKMKVQAEIAQAMENKTLISGNKYEGVMSDGTILHMFIDNESVTTAFPVI